LNDCRQERQFFYTHTVIKKPYILILLKGECREIGVLSSSLAIKNTRPPQYCGGHGFWLRSVAALRRFVSADASTAAPPSIGHLPGASSLVCLVAAASLWLFNFVPEASSRSGITLTLDAICCGSCCPYGGWWRSRRPASLCFVNTTLRSSGLAARIASSNVDEHL
jgi:hypothetical protein